MVLTVPFVAPVVTVPRSVTDLHSRMTPVVVSLATAWG